MPRATLLVLLLCALSACARPVPPPSMQLTPPLRAGDEPVHALSASLGDDSLGLSTPQDIAITRSGFAVVDHGNDRIVMLSPELRPIRSVARSGSGPGEFQLPMYVEPLENGLAVGDLTNRRITILDSADRVVRTQRLPVAVRHFAIDGGGRMWMAARSRSHYLMRIDHDGSDIPFAPRALEFYARADRRRHGMPFGAGADLVARTSDGYLHVFDNRVGALLRFDANGRRNLARSLPEALATELATNRDQRVAALRQAKHKVVSAPLAKDLVVTAEGRLLLLYAGARSFGLLIEPGTYAARLLELPEGNKAQPLWSATAAVLENDHVTVISHADVFTYRLHTTRIAAR